ncbi:MAG TPA: hypothetical protein VNQ79_15800 [Blastocatellia bacterium]|nr:hypothetical protein [Blastocatellia bacterium]
MTNTATALPELAVIRPRNGFIEQPDALPAFTGSSYEDHVSAWIQVRQEIQDRQWRLGAVAASVATRYGDESLKTFAFDVGENVKTLYEYRRVYSAFKNSNRLENLSWKHHQLALQSDNPAALLERASDEQWTTARLRQALDAEETGRLAAQAEEIERNAGAAVKPERVEVIAEQWKHTRAAVERFALRCPELRHWTQDYIDRIEEEIQSGLADGPQLVISALRIGCNVIADINDETGLHHSRIYRILQRLIEQGQVRTEAIQRGSGHGGDRRTIFYYLTNP